VGFFECKAKAVCASQMNRLAAVHPPGSGLGQI